MPIPYFLHHCLEKNNDERISLTFLRFYAPFFFSSSRARFIILVVVTQFPTVPCPNLPEKQREPAEDATSTDRNREEGSRESAATQARILGHSLFSPRIPAVFLSREIVVRRFIYARSAKFTGCVAGAALINRTVRFKRFWREKRQYAFPHFFIGPRPGISLARERSICQAARSGKRMLKNAIRQG